MEIWRGAKKAEKYGGREILKEHQFAIQHVA